MLQARTRWRSTDCRQEHIERLVNDLHIEPLIARLLVVRGLTQSDQARRFLFGDESDFHDPFLLHGMETAVNRIQEAIRNRQKIRIYGDYDADGVSSTALMSRVLSYLGADYDYYIPNRFTEGYGLNIPAIQKAIEQGTELLITVDTGISAVEQVDFARSAGLDVIITDHHEPPEILPEAFAIVNPKKPECNYPFKMLAGVGVAFKLAHALIGRVPEEWYELALIGTVADLVPLLDENRLIVKNGLQRINDNPSTGLRTLLRYAGAKDGEITTTSIGFGVAPRINAGGRLDSADEGVKLLLTDQEQEAEHYAHSLDQLNRERQKLVEETTAEAIEAWESRPSTEDDQFIVVAKPGWNVGIVGIVASKLVEKYYRPAIVLSIDSDQGKAKGSARSIEGLDLYQSLSDCKDLLLQYGGHTMAAGLTMSAELVHQLRERLNTIASTQLSEDDYIPISRIDAECTLDEVDLPFVEQLEQLAPFGIGNPSPKWLLTGAKVVEVRTLGKTNNHLKLQLSGQRRLDAIGFQWAHVSSGIALQSEPQVVGELQINEWNGLRRPQIMIKDISVPHIQVFDWRTKEGDSTDRIQKWEQISLQDEFEQKSASVIFSSAFRENRTDKHVDPYAVRYVAFLDLPERLTEWEASIRQFPNMERAYCIFAKDSSQTLPTVPDRDQFGSLYRIFTSLGQVETNHLAALSGRTGLSVVMIRFMMDVFMELGFLAEEGNTVKVVSSPRKRELTESVLLSRRLERDRVEKLLLHSSSEELNRYIQGVLN